MPHEFKISLGAVALLAAAAWWFNLSPPAKRCFERGGTTFDLDGSCLQINVVKK